jgi:nucleoside-diphosphate-sugar epimerase
MRVAVTGGSGQLGTLVLRRLCADRRFREVVSLDVKPPLVASGKLRAVTADVRDPDFARHLEGCEVLIHLAFLVAAFPGRQIFDAINVGGSKNVFEAAARAGVKEIVYASSIAAYGVVPGHPVPIVETTARVHQPDFAYSANKWEVEDFLDAFEKDHPDIAIARLRPSTLIGTRMEHPLGYMLKRRRFPATNTPFPLVWDEDVADAVMLCIEKKARGAFNVVAEELQRGEELAKTCGMKVLGTPGIALRAWSHASPYLARLGLATPLDPAWIGKTDVPMIASAEKARRELGWKPRCPNAVDVMKRYVETVPGMVDPRIAAFMGAVALASRWKPAELDLGGFNSHVHLCLTGPGGGDFGIEVREKRLRVSFSPPRPPTATVTLTARHFLDLLAGKAEFATSQLVGTLRCEGEGHAAMIVGSMITLYRARTKALKGAVMSRSRVGRWILERTAT